LFLADIEAKLQEIDPNVDYGLVNTNRKETAWNYIVFNRTGVRYSGNKTAASDTFDVHIIRENYIPDGVETQVVDKLCELPGVRVSGEAVFNYTQKPNTNIVVEMLTIPFVRARKS
jgi:hypothetical protein